MAPHRLPGAARRDRPSPCGRSRPSRRRRRRRRARTRTRAAIAVGDVGERRRALVGGDDEVRVVAVVAHDVGRRHDLAADDVVGDVEQPADERPVAGDDLRAAARRGPAGRALDDEAALGARPGTMTAFLTVCAFISPRTSVRKSSRRSDQRRPPRATGPPRRCTPSTRGEYTKISNTGAAAGRSGTCAGSSLNDERRASGARPAPAGSSSSAASPARAAGSSRRMRSSSRLATSSIAPLDLVRRAARRLARGRRLGPGSNRTWNSSTSIARDPRVARRSVSSM